MSPPTRTSPAGKSGTRSTTSSELRRSRASYPDDLTEARDQLLAQRVRGRLTDEAAHDLWAVWCRGDIRELQDVVDHLRHLRADDGRSPSSAPDPETDRLLAERLRRRDERQDAHRARVAAAARRLGADVLCGLLSDAEAWQRIDRLIERRDDELDVDVRQLPPHESEAIAAAAFRDGVRGVA